MMIRVFSFAILILVYASLPARADCMLVSKGETRAEGTIVYNKDFDVLQACIGTKWKALGKIRYGFNEPCNPANRIPGCSSEDGTIYAGQSPDGDRPMFTTRCDYGQTWGGNKCEGVRLARPWNDGTRVGVNTGVNNLTTGFANTAMLMTIDSDPTEDGVQNFMAAHACGNLSIHGKNDWYLPAVDELAILVYNHDEIRNFLVHAGSRYWTSTQPASNATYARFMTMVGGSSSMYADNPMFIRCVRKD